jgi:hypothetical protein
MLRWTARLICGAHMLLKRMQTAGLRRSHLGGGKHRRAFVAEA